MTSLRPILMSTALHGMFVIVLALLPWGFKPVQKHPQTIMVQLIETPPAPAAVKPAKSAPTPEVKAPSIPKSVRADPPPLRHIRTAVNQVRSRVHAVAIPTSRSIEPPREAFISPSKEASPVFLEIPRSFPVAGPIATGAQEAMTLPIDTITPPSTLSSTSMVAPPFRPIPTGQTEPRPVLRDSAAEKVTVTRSLPRAGDNLRPDYPRTAREAGWEGTVMLRVEVLPDGSAGTVSVKRSSGYAILDDAAITAVRRWHFPTAMDGNFPVRRMVDQPVTFNLNTS